MFTKTSKATNITVAILGVLVVAAGSYFSHPQAVASAGDLPTPHAEPAKRSEKAGKLQSDTHEALTVTQNGITVEITSARVISTGIEIGICYTAPDNAEWRPLPDHLFYGTSEVYPDEMEFLADGKITGIRCALIRYRIDDLKTMITPIKFSILQFYAPGREMYSPCEELQQRLDTNPQAQAYGLTASCEANADGSTNVTLVHSNGSVTTEEAQKALDTIASAEISGNWEFMITDIKK